jgi:hypothetical protein
MLPAFGRSLALSAVLALVGCGGGSGSGGSGSPTTPTPTAPPANRPPSITTATANPPWGISTLTVHNFTAAATDPDGDAVTYSWNFGDGTSSNSQSVSRTFNNANTFTYSITLTARDAQGASSTAAVQVTSVTVAGTWDGTLTGAPFTATFTQYLGGLFDGSWQMPSVGFSGITDPGEVPTIQANGQFEARFKVQQGAFVDFYYRGSIDPTGRQMTGNLQGSGFSGQIMILNKR